ncbi:hypothetical protein AXG93_2752s2360 [Marchantia polymorpha subsp. ruderalis]|uniref:Uncharacterized protein n=1 Tax=Marchantia polymorpha subsp. ruderalis TaxID=1480154 RepID=A0A176VTU1_MARPO|nr:hypothetical protein AXG93_2752s2360 [Marchantia polymorpha subsp. ruderalis]
MDYLRQFSLGFPTLRRNYHNPELGRTGAVGFGIGRRVVKDATQEAGVSARGANNDCLNYYGDAANPGGRGWRIHGWRSIVVVAGMGRAEPRDAGARGVTEATGARAKADPDWTTGRQEGPERRRRLDSPEPGARRASRTGLRAGCRQAEEVVVAMAAQDAAAATAASLVHRRRCPDELTDMRSQACIADAVVPFFPGFFCSCSRALLMHPL